LPTSLSSAPGNYRVKLSWKPGPDPSIAKYRVFWNNGADSVEVAASTHNTADTITVVVPGLTEYTYSFTLYSYDDKGNRSIPKEVNNIKVYGNSYKQSLTNRFLVASSPYELVAEGIRLYFETPDTINVSTQLRYTFTDGTSRTATLQPEDNSILLPGYKSGTKVFYQSAYIPVNGAIDTFYTKSEDSLSNVIIPLDKSIFAALKLTNDVGTYSGETSLSQLWNGNTTPTGYPNIFHSDAGTKLPHHFTFDLGQQYSGLAQFEIIGRDCCNNPVKFEIWGISDLTNAVTLSPSNSAGWKAESLARGWKLLKEVTRSDNGQAPFKVTLDEVDGTIRYIRIRVLNVDSGDEYFSNISEVSFWRK
jgi:hypothetical protein